MQDAYVDNASPLYEIASEAGAAYYDLAGGEGLAAEPLPEEALRKTARWAMAKGDATTGLELLSGSFEGNVYSIAQSSVRKSAEAEPGARWSRVARPGACAFCRMMMIRGDVYKSQEAALSPKQRSRYHDHCRCLAVAIRPGQVWTPPAYAEQWDEEYQQVTRRVGTDLSRVVTAWDQLAS